MESTADCPEYLRLLRAYWAGAGRPAYRTVAARTGFSVSAVHAALTGRTPPSRPLLEKLAQWLAPGKLEVELVVAAYDAFKGPSTLRMGPGVVTPTAQAEIVASAIREGLHEIAEAIRSLKQG